MSSFVECLKRSHERSALAVESRCYSLCNFISERPVGIRRSALASTCSPQCRLTCQRASCSPARGPLHSCPRPPSPCQRQAPYHPSKASDLAIYESCSSPRERSHPSLPWLVWRSPSLLSHSMAMAMAAPAPSPAHILRMHKAQINCVAFSEDNERLYSADLEGWVTLTSTRTQRPLARWQAHSDSVLKVQEWDEAIIR